ncbi:hypothetical protein C356_04435 [Cryptococcus neoformans c45]|nr:hypothetical protein C356_04435 [Cryptococcus neoformans var. grubii c45]
MKEIHQITSALLLWIPLLAIAVPAPTTTTVAYAAASTIPHFWRRMASKLQTCKPMVGRLIHCLAISKDNSSWPALTIAASVRQDLSEASLADFTIYDSDPRSTSAIRILWTFGSEVSKALENGLLSNKDSVQVTRVNLSMP